MRKAAMPTFAAKQVCATLGVSHGTLNSWAHEGFFRKFDAAFTRPGKARQFSFDDLLILSILSKFLDFDFSPRKAWSLSLECGDYIKRFSPEQINIILYEDGREQILCDNQKPGLGAIALKLSIYPRTRVAELRRRLAASGDPKVAAMSRQKSAGLRAPKRAPKPSQDKPGDLA